MQPLSKNLLLKNHPDLSFTMRAKLINWLFEVQEALTGNILYD